MDVVGCRDLTLYQIFSILRDDPFPDLVVKETVEQTREKTVSKFLISSGLQMQILTPDHEAYVDDSPELTPGGYDAALFIYGFVKDMFGSFNRKREISGSISFDNKKGTTEVTIYKFHYRKVGHYYNILNVIPVDILLLLTTYLNKVDACHLIEASENPYLHNTENPHPRLNKDILSLLYYTPKMKDQVFSGYAYSSSTVDHFIMKYPSKKMEILTMTYIKSSRYKSEGKDEVNRYARRLLLDEAAEMLKTQGVKPQFEGDPTAPWINCDYDMLNAYSFSYTYNDLNIICGFILFRGESVLANLRIVEKMVEHTSTMGKGKSLREYFFETYSEDHHGYHSCFTDEGDRKGRTGRKFIEKFREIMSQKIVTPYKWISTRWHSSEVSKAQARILDELDNIIICGWDYASLCRTNNIYLALKEMGSEYANRLVYKARKAYMGDPGDTTHQKKINSIMLKRMLELDIVNIDPYTRFRFSNSHKITADGIAALENAKVILTRDNYGQHHSEYSDGTLEEIRYTEAHDYETVYRYIIKTYNLSSRELIITIYEWLDVYKELINEFTKDETSFMKDCPYYQTYPEEKDRRMAKYNKKKALFERFIVASKIKGVVLPSIKRYIKKKGWWYDESSNQDPNSWASFDTRILCKDIVKFMDSHNLIS